MNGKFMHEQAASFADRLRKEAGEDPRLQVERAFRLSFNRPANLDEIDDSLAFLQDQAKRVEARPDAKNRELSAKQALQAFCLVILNANEFVTID